MPNLISPDTSLTDWVKEPSIHDLKADLESARPFQKSNTEKIDHWNDLRNITGKAKPVKVKGRSSIQPKLVRRQAEWRYPALTEPFLSSDKLFSVNPVTFEDKVAAEQNELVLNYQARTQFDLVKFIDDYARSTVDDGTCFVRLGWERKTKKVMEDKPVFDHYQIHDEERLQVFQQVLELRDSNPREYQETIDEATKACIELYDSTQIPTVARQVGVEQVEVEKIVVNRPTIKVRDPKRIYVDPSCEGDFSKALFLIEVFETNLASLTEAGIYKNLDKIDWDSVSTTDDENISNNVDDFSFKDRTRKKTLAYEYWGYYDIRGDNTLVAIVATWIGNVLIRLEENPFPDQEIPYVCVVYSPVKRELYGEPDAEILEENQQILGAVTRGAVDLLGRSANAQEGIAKNMLDPLNRRRFQNGQNYEFNPGVNPENGGYILHKFPEIPQSAMLMINMQNSDAEALSGVKSFSGGLSSQAYGDVATGIRGVMDAASKREMAILRRMAQGMVTIGRKIVAMNGQFLRDQEIIRVTNDNHVAISREDLAGNFDLIVDISTTAVDESKAQDLGFMLQTMGPNMDPEVSMQVLAEIARLKRMPTLAETLKRWKPTPDPVQQQLRELELIKAQKEIAKLDAEIAALGGKALKDEATAESISIDTLLNASGETHKRSVETSKAQSQGNQNLQVTKAMLTQQDPRKTEPNIGAAIGYNALTQ